MLQYLEDWVSKSRLGLEAEGVQVSLEFSPENRDKISAWLDLDSPGRLVRLIVWESGEAILSVGDVVSGALLADEQLEVSGVFGLEQALDDAVAWALSRE
ncbi:immunity protein TriTu family protein [Austwickia chelonae]|uniref:immunity protein TriTu family protein n=1 Tax=Austwickia chelonae TaxID=100225 RepID=UPI0019671D08|nr:hypothetical protein [Austwickia chelonae]